MHRIPRLLIAGTKSGCGKTTITCGLLAALKMRGLSPVSCKCGPDYIDPMFHKRVLGVESSNLDLFFCEERVVGQLFAEHTSKADIAVIEGVMGYYDGMSLGTDKGSSYHIAACIQSPVILVVSCKGMALSLAPVIKGMLEFRKNSNIQGIMLNGVSGGLYPRLKEMIETELSKAGHSIPVLGYLPMQKEMQLAGRHLGLVTPEEIPGIQEQIWNLGRLLSETADLDALIRIAGNAPALDVELKETDKESQVIPIGIAKDRAFCFYYADNLKMLESLGCRLVPFSPLEDAGIPEGIKGLILGGGYPELYAKALSDNTSMKTSIREAVEEGMPCIAECGGFMYLHEQMEDADGEIYQMAGVIKGKTYRTGHLVRFGYVELYGNHSGVKLKGHEFHYWDSTDNGSSYLAVKPDKSKRWECIHETENLYAGFPHIHYYSNPGFARAFVEKCKVYPFNTGEKETRRVR